MLGNVWEWTRTEYQETYYDLFDGRDDIDSNNHNSMVLRGGSFLQEETNIHSSCRINSKLFPYKKDIDIGFRVIAVKMKNYHLIHSKEFLVKLNMKMNDHLNMEEIRTICFHMDIDHEQLKGSVKSEIVRELISHCQRHEKVDELLEKCSSINPNIDWYS
jgi:hypothetical protein